MKEHPCRFYPYWIQMLVIALPQFVGICFTADEVDYMLQCLSYAMKSDNFMFEPTLSQHMYDRFSIAIPRFTEAWNAIENYKDFDELLEIEKKYEASARIAMLVMEVRYRTYDWRRECSITK